MKKMKTTKQALMLSMVSLMLCFAMLTGTTFAWFTDQETSAGNKIIAGDLQVDLLVRDEDGTYKSIVKDQSPIFDYEYWEPGYHEVANVQVANIGTLAFQYSVQIITEGLVDALKNNEIMLSDVIDVYYADKEVIMPDRNSFKAAVANNELKHVGTLTEVIFGGSMINDTLLKGESDYATIVLKMQESAGNEYQGLSVGNSFDIRVVATQLAYEEDSFDNTYDDIDLPSATVMVFEPELLDLYQLDAGCAYLAEETWDDSWSYDYVADAPSDGTPSYAYYFADFVVSFDKDHAAGEVGLWGYYESWGAEATFKMDAITANTDYRIIPLAEDKLDIAMGNISYRQLLKDVKTFACGVTEGSLKAGETITVTLRLYETALNGGNSFVETGAYHDIAVYTYTEATVELP